MGLLNEWMNVQDSIWKNDFSSVSRYCSCHIVGIAIPDVWVPSDCSVASGVNSVALIRVVVFIARTWALVDCVDAHQHHGWAALMPRTGWKRKRPATTSHARFGSVMDLELGKGMGILRQGVFPARGNWFPVVLLFTTVLITSMREFTAFCAGG